MSIMYNIRQILEPVLPCAHAPFGYVDRRHTHLYLAVLYIHTSIFRNVHVAVYLAHSDPHLKTTDRRRIPTTES